MSIIMEILQAMKDIREELAPIEKERLQRIKKCKIMRHEMAKGEVK